MVAALEKIRRQTLPEAALLQGGPHPKDLVLQRIGVVAVRRGIQNGCGGGSNSPACTEWF
jgi:hypothetical protein